MTGGRSTAAKRRTLSEVGRPNFLSLKHTGKPLSSTRPRCSPTASAPGFALADLSGKDFACHAGLHCPADVFLQKTARLG